MTRFLGSLVEAKRTVDVLGDVRAQGLPVPRHHHVVEVAGSVYFVQERLPEGRAQRLTPARIDAIVAVNDRFAGALALRSDVPEPPMCLGATRSDPADDALARYSARSRDVLGEIVRIRSRVAAEMGGQDLVHIDLTAANVLFDQAGKVTGVVDWNLGAYRGDRLFALVKTRFDREWFVRSPAADPVENAAAAHLDDILRSRIAPGTLRTYWAHWMLYQLRCAINSRPPQVVEWHLEMAESRLQ